LKAGQRFADGTPIEAKSVAEALDRLRTAAHPSRPAKPAVAPELWSSVEDVQVTSPTAVLVRLKAPDAGLLSLLAWERTGIVKPGTIGPGLVPVGSGPYRLSAANPPSNPPDETLDLAANPHHSPPARTTLAFVATQPGTSRLFWIVSGQGQLVADLPPRLATELSARPALRVGAAPAPGLVVMGFNLGREPTSIPRVRQALAHAIDRSALSGHLYGGRSRVPAGFFAPYLAADVAQGSWPATDLVEAKQLLERVMPAHGMLLTLWIVADESGAISSPEALATAIAASLRKLKIGLLVSIVRPVDFTKRLAKTVPDIVVTPIDEPCPDPGFRVRALVSPAHPLGCVVGWSDKDSRKALAESLIITESAREYLLTQLSSRIASQLVAVPLAIPAVYWAYRAPLTELEFMPSGAPDFVRIGP
jgi:ABC-type transport system substrate-binding protein